MQIVAQKRKSLQLMMRRIRARQIASRKVGVLGFGLSPQSYLPGAATGVSPRALIVSDNESVLVKS